MQQASVDAAQPSLGTCRRHRLHPNASLVRPVPTSPEPFCSDQFRAPHHRTSGRFCSNPALGLGTPPRSHGQGANRECCELRRCACAHRPRQRPRHEIIGTTAVTATRQPDKCCHGLQMTTSAFSRRSPNTDLGNNNTSPDKPRKCIQEYNVALCRMPLEGNVHGRPSSISCDFAGKWALKART